MIYYQDRTFCAGDGCLNFNDCPRALTQDVREDAEWKGFLIAQFANPKELQCYVDPSQSGETSLGTEENPGGRE